MILLVSISRYTHCISNGTRTTIHCSYGCIISFYRVRTEWWDLYVCYHLITAVTKIPSLSLSKEVAMRAGGDLPPSHKFTAYHWWVLSVFLPLSINQYPNLKPTVSDLEYTTASSEAIRANHRPLVLLDVPDTVIGRASCTRSRSSRNIQIAK